MATRLLLSPRDPRRTVLLPLALPLGFLIAAVLGLLLVGPSIAGPSPAGSTSARSLTEPDSFVSPGPASRSGGSGEPSAAAGRVLQRHDCWTGAAPADMQGRAPGHVVVTRADRVRYGGPRLVGVALRHVFEEPVAGLSVQGFCR